MHKCLSPPKVVTQTKSLSSRNNHVAQTLRAATTAVAASGLPFRVPGFGEVQGLCVESFLQGHQDWLVHGQPGRWMAEATTVWVVLGDLMSRSAQRNPVSDLWPALQQGAAPEEATQSMPCRLA